MSKFCTSCGKEIPDGVSFCTECGKPQNAQQSQNTQKPQYTPPQYIPPQPQYTQPPYIPPQNTDTVPPKGSQYEPVSTGKFIGLMLLMCIPVVGIILTAIWALSAKKINQRSFARAALVVMAIMLVISMLIGMMVTKFVKNLVNEITEELELQTQNIQNNEDSPLGALGQLTGILGSLGGEETAGNLAQIFESMEEMNQATAGN